MRYRVAPLPDWDELDGADRIRVGRHYRVPVDGDDVLVIPHGRPGWLRLPPSVVALLAAIDGLDVAGVRASPDFADVSGTLRALYDGGLLYIGGRTGLRAERAQADPATSEPPTALLLKLTGACDMACSYCYDYDAQRWPGRMDLDLARCLIVECLRPGRQLTLMFHGGEPMLRFTQMRDLVEFADRTASTVGATVRYTIQTNGLHFTESAVEFLRRHRFAVGVSLDGPAHVHDRNRIDHGGRGTHQRIAANFDRFPEFMRSEVGYISVIGAGTDAEELDATWRFFRDLGVLTWKLLPADAEGRATGQAETASFRKTFVDFLSARLEAVLDGALDHPYITNLVQLIEPFLTLDRPNMCMKMPCGASTDLLVLDAVGAVRACDCSYHPVFQLLPAGARASEAASQPSGGLVTRGRSTASSMTLRARERWLLDEAPCASCPWLHQCAGTCPARALINNGSLFSIDDLECETRLALFPRILADLSRPNSALRRYHDYAKRRAGPALAAAAAPPR
ncbi:hypothetical protein GCM10009557_20750 [Virgisporangium ochraceum]|uniref:Radical SAM core domain-containing protein n=1 Tax=Virgisporangium ochraceum TaxID=65505 RepID=A0A8J4EE37_9ACTN|nr:radical SAM protein [Virgisporangium ochraceum]GIJ71334.1 hypothetical protein Voc01_062510 [Virgisporangium ochraceum]